MPDELLIAGATLLTPRQRLESAWLLARDGRIAALGQGAAPELAPAAERIDARGLLVAPGLIDIHIHGGGGADTMDAKADALRMIARSQAAGGTTAWVATTVTASLADTRRAAEVAMALVGQSLGGAQLLGVHLEGPYLCPEQRGAHDPAHIRLPDPADYEALFALLGPAAQRGGRSRVTAAPEMRGALEMGQAMRRAGIQGAIGHSNADLDTVRKALASGYAHVTHLYSCNSGLRIDGGYKTPGINEAALLFDDLSIELIGDGYHVPPALIELVVKVKGPDRVCLVTDAIRAAGLGAGRYRLWHADILVEDGVAKLPDRSKFAGSVCTMGQAVRTAVAAGIRLEQALRMAGATPARLLGLDHKGELAPGKDADLVFLDSRLYPQRTIVGGRTVFAVA